MGGLHAMNTTKYVVLLGYGDDPCGSPLTTGCSSGSWLCSLKFCRKEERVHAPKWRTMHGRWIFAISRVAYFSMAASPSGSSE